MGGVWINGFIKLFSYMGMYAVAFQFTFRRLNLSFFLFYLSHTFGLVRTHAGIWLRHVLFFYYCITRETSCHKVLNTKCAARIKSLDRGLWDITRRFFISILLYFLPCSIMLLLLHSPANKNKPLAFSAQYENKQSRLIVRIFHTHILLYFDPNCFYELVFKSLVGMFNLQITQT